MERIEITADHGLAEAAKKAAAHLGNGGVIAVPTETVYGLMALWEDQVGRERIFELKARPREKLLQMLAPDLRSAQAHGLLPDRRLEVLARRFWPGPLTVVGHAENGSSIGLRIPDHPLTQAILREVHTPLAATSANRSGAPAAHDAVTAIGGLDGEPDLLIDGGTTDGQASTVVSLLGDDIRILRAGPIIEAELRRELVRRDR